ncbi:MAG: C-GCAxxG-C-C family protein [Bacillota bacterium]|jgi:C_GCAxxG_C_C family probable redox protein
MMKEAEVIKNFEGGIDCSQIVFSEFSEQLGVDKETAKKIAASFGAGMWNGEVCGAVAGAMMVIGLKYGHTKLGDEKAKGQTIAKVNQFKEAFEREHGSIVCREILGYDIPEELDIVMEQREFFKPEKCPSYVCTAIKILNDIL